MVAFGKQQGKGLIDTLLSPFTVEKYQGEKHARSLDPEHFLQGYNFVGPSTRLDIRLMLRLLGLLLLFRSTLL